MTLKVHFLPVVVAVIKDKQGRVLIAKRADEAHQGGLWEFPGGKIEAGETVVTALKRELSEELGINLKTANPLIKIKHHYADLSVILDVWEINDFSGTAYGKEGQQVKWVSLDTLSQYDFPAANKAIITAAKLPHCYAILDDSDRMPLLPKLDKILSNGVKLIQMRLKISTEKEIEQFLNKARPLCQQYQAEILINSAVVNEKAIERQGLHLTSTDLMALKSRPNNSGWLAASCHNRLQLQQAEKIGVDFVVLAPILPTPTHPDTQALGWDVALKLVEDVSIPVFALGGVSFDDLHVAQEKGMHGIAGIRAFL
ncbi:MAG: Nudix family hydrolase [Methylococcales bacterium]|nr:Nudix family hydrolase [Methylococcales bacterium]